MDFMAVNFFSENQDKENSVSKKQQLKSPLIKSQDFNSFEYYINN